MALKNGTRVGPYVVIDALGTGGMAHIYRVREVDTRREVAVKVGLIQKESQIPTFQNALRREVDLLSRGNTLSSPIF